MQLTHFTDFSLRVLMYLSYQERKQLVTITEIAEQFNIPRNHLVKVVNNLVKQGWINAARGRNGGLSLGVDPQTLKLGGVIQLLENHKSLIDCKRTDCQLDGHCHLQRALGEGLKVFYQFMDNYTLADVVKDPTMAAIIKLHPVK